MNGPILTERLCIRPLEPRDTESVFRYRSDPEIVRFQAWKPNSIDEIREFITSLRDTDIDTPGEWYQLGLRLRSTDELIGGCGLQSQVDDPLQVEIGITLAVEFHRQGYATEALRAVFGYLFTELQKHRVIASVNPRNTASVALFERIGMRREAYFVESQRFEGEFDNFEQAAASNLEKPYRQRVYRLSQLDDDLFESRVYTFDDPLEYAGAYTVDEPLKGLTPENLSLREGCSILLRCTGTAFEGSTLGSLCGSTLRGASSATSEVRITPNMVLSWDRGFDAAGTHIWDAEKGPYEFRRK